MKPTTINCTIEGYLQETKMALDEAKTKKHPKAAKIKTILVKPFQIIFDYFRKDPSLIIVFALWFALVSSEVWIPYLIGVITQDGYWFGIGSACWIFWAGPGTPFLAIVLGLTLGTEAVWKAITKRRKKK